MQRGGDEAAEHAFPGLAGTDLRRELVAAEAAAGEVRADVRRDDQQQQEQQQLRPERRADAPAPATPAPAPEARRPQPSCGLTRAGATATQTSAKTHHSSAAWIRRSISLALDAEPPRGRDAGGHERYIEDPR